MLLLYHAAAGHEAGVRIGTHIPKLFFAISDHEMAAMLPRIPTHGAGTVRIHGIGPAGEILTDQIRADSCVFVFNSPSALTN